MTMATKMKERPADDAASRAIAVVDRAHMLSAAAVAGVVAPRNTIPILSNMVIEAEGECLSMTATDLDIMVRLSVPARCEGSRLATTIPAKQIAAVVGSSDEGCQIGIEMGSGDTQLLIRAARSRYRLPTLPTDDFPIMPFTPTGETIEMVGADLARALARTAIAESSDPARYYLHGTLIACRDGKLFAVATDGLVLTEVELGGAPSDWPDTLFPSKLTALLARLLKDEKAKVTIERHDVSRVRISWGSWSVISKLVDGSFPDWSRIIPAPNPARGVIVDSATIQRALRRLQPMSTEKKPIAIIDVSGDRLLISCRSPDAGSGEEEVPASADVGDFRFAAFTDDLRKILAAASEDSVCIDLPEEAVAPMRVAPAPAGGFIGMIMLRRF